ncbi:MAG: metal ABC transporter substrate-binding protein [Paracoccaceae bacterium]|nr:metal ABC transporter substrate-binding protein [Paracoccaceae bacterium]
MRVLPILIAMLPSLAWSEPLRIVTDIPPIHSLVSRVMGDRGQIDVMLDASADPHHFQLRPSQSRAISRADVVIWVGEEMTPWFARAKDAIAADVPSLTFTEADVEDPHVWLNIDHAAQMVAEIADTLAGLDAEGAAYYRENAGVAAKELAELTARVSETLTGIEDAPFVVGHDAYDYFTDQFGLNLVGSLTDIHDSPASVQHISDLVRLAESGDVKCVFPEGGESLSLANVLVDAGALLGDPLDPEGVFLTPGPELYDDLVTNLAKSLSNCLSG